MRWRMLSHLLVPIAPKWHNSTVMGATLNLTYENAVPDLPVPIDIHSPVHEIIMTKFLKTRFCLHSGIRKCLTLLKLKLIDHSDDHLIMFTETPRGAQEGGQLQRKLLENEPMLV